MWLDGRGRGGGRRVILRVVVVSMLEFLAGGGGVCLMFFQLWGCGWVIFFLVALCRSYVMGVEE